MGAFCSSQSLPSHPHPHPHDPPPSHHSLPERLPLTFSPPLMKRSSRTNQVPSLFDLCLEELCNSLCEPEKKEEDVPSPPISSPSSSLPSFVSYGMSRAIWPSLLGATFLRTSVPPVRCRALSLSARHSPEMGPSSNPHPHPHIPRSTLTFHHRHLHLPEPIIQVIFDYMLSERLLTLSHCTLFTRAHLSTISLGSYPGVTDDWLHLLLASVPYQTCSDTQQILTSPGRIKRQISATRRAQPSARVSWQGQGESEEEKGLPMSVMRALTTRASIIPTTSSTSTSTITSPLSPLLSPAQPVSAASVSTRTISPPIHIAQLCGDTSPVPIGLSQSPPQQESMPSLTCLSPVSSPTSTSTSSDSSIGDSSPTSPVLSSSDSSSASSPLSLSPFNLTSTRRISQLPSPLITHSLTHLDVSKCQALTEYALRPLVACPALKYLNVEGCTQLSDTLFTLILRDKYDLTYLNLAGLKGVTNATLQVLSDKDGMKTLILDQCTITDSGLRDLNDFHNLEHLSLGWCGPHVTHDGLHWLCNNSSLTYLNIAFTGVTCASCFAELHHLIHLNVAGTKLSESHWKIPHQFPTLTHLDLQRSRLTEIPIGVLHHGLQILDVSFTSMSAPKLAYQIASLARMKPCKILSIDPDVDEPLIPSTSHDTVIPLHTLCMESCSVDNAVAKSIALCANLTKLNLCDTDITNDGVKCLTSLTNLTHLSLSGCQLTNTALIVFETLINLKVLHLDCPTITDGGLHYLRHLHSLEFLDLFETHITDMGLDHLHSLRALQHLEICSGKLTNVGLNKIAQRLINLTSLNLSQNPGITDAGVSVLSYLPSLRHINLSGTSITHKGLTFIQSLPLLTHVSLFGCKVKPMSNKIKELPRGVQLGVDEGIVAIE